MRKAAVGGGVSVEAPRLFAAAEWACRKANLATERHKMPPVLATIIFSVAGVEALLAELLEFVSAVRNDPKSGNVDDLDDFYQGITQLCDEDASLVRKARSRLLGYTNKLTGDSSKRRTSFRNCAARAPSTTR